MGLLSDDEVRDIRKQISYNVLQPLFEDMGFDVDIDIENGFNINVKCKMVKEYDKQNITH